MSNSKNDKLYIWILIIVFSNAVSVIAAITLFPNLYSTQKIENKEKNETPIKDIISSLKIREENLQIEKKQLEIEKQHNQMILKKIERIKNEVSYSKFINVKSFSALFFLFILSSILSFLFYSKSRELKKRIKKEKENINKEEKQIYEIVDYLDEIVKNIPESSQKNTQQINKIEKMLALTEKKIDDLYSKKESIVDKTVSSAPKNHNNEDKVHEEKPKEVLNHKRPEEEIEFESMPQESVKLGLASKNPTEQVMYLYNLKWDIEKIARELNMGKGEVELIVKFHQNK